MRQADEHQGDVSHMQGAAQSAVVQWTQPAKLQYPPAGTSQ